MKYEKNWIWQIIYRVYPPVLRILEKIRIHNSRQDFLIGKLKSERSCEELKRYLLSQGFETAVLAWMDPGEQLSLRKIDQQTFQYHIRLFSDGEIRGHYEYSAEGNPWGHITEKTFEPRRSYFEKLLSAFLTDHPRK